MPHLKVVLLSDIEGCLSCVTRLGTSQLPYSPPDQGLLLGRSRAAVSSKIPHYPQIQSLEPLPGWLVQVCRPRFRRSRDQGFDRYRIRPPNGSRNRELPTTA